MILSEALQASANRVVLEYNSIVRRNACCAPSVILKTKSMSNDFHSKTNRTNLSASSRIIILCRPLGNETFDCANILIFVRTISMPRSFDAFISSTASRNESPNICRAKHKTLVV